MENANAKVPAKDHLENFLRAITDLAGQNMGFDCVIAPANSGTLMAELAKMVFDGLCINFPPRIIMPIYTLYRFPNHKPGQPLPFDNLLSAPDVRNQIRSVPELNNFLFLDDEIGHGSALRASFELVFAAMGRPVSDIRRHCTIIAEANGFDWHYDVPGMQTKFIPYAVRPSPDVSGLVYRALPQNILNHTKEILGDVDEKETACTLLDLPVKRLVGKRPGLSDELLVKAKRSKQFPGLQQEFKRYLASLIKKVRSYQAWNPKSYK